MTKPRQYTKELLSDRAASARAYREGRGPIRRVVAGASSAPVPVEYAPRSVSDPRPWVQWHYDDGTEEFRFSGRECWAEPVPEQDRAADLWAVERSIVLRLAACGVAMEQDPNRELASHLFADGSEVNIWGDDVTGTRMWSMRHTTGEHGRLRWSWVSADGSRETIGEFPADGQDPSFGRDSAALVETIVSLAREHGPAWQQYAREDVRLMAHAWAQAAGVELPLPPPCEGV